MDWLFRRLLGALALALACTLVLAGIGALVGSPVLGAALGAMLATGVLVLRDSVKASRLMAWMRVAQGTAPRDTGLWGELAYRIERAFVAGEKRVVEERQRLEQFLAAIEASPNGVMMLDANEQMLWCNRVAAEHFGLDPEGDRLQRLTNLVRSPTFVAYLQSGRYDEGATVPGPLGRTTLSVLLRELRGLA